jgi:hypothetical protein
MGRCLRVALVVCMLAELAAVIVGGGVARAAGCTAGSAGATTTFSSTGAEQCYTLPAGTQLVQVSATGHDQAAAHHQLGRLVATTTPEPLAAALIENGKPGYARAVLGSRTVRRVTPGITVRLRAVRLSA